MAVVAAALRVHLAPHPWPRGRRVEHVPNLCALIRDRQDPQPGEGAGVKRLPAALRVEGRAIQGHEEAPFLLAAAQEYL